MFTAKYGPYPPLSLVRPFDTEARDRADAAWMGVSREDLERYGRPNFRGEHGPTTERDTA